MHYKTRTYLDEAVEVRSTGFDMNEVWSMYAKISFWSCGSLARDLVSEVGCEESENFAPTKTSQGITLRPYQCCTCGRSPLSL